MKNKISILIISFLSIIFVAYPLLGQAASVGFAKVLDITETGARLDVLANCGSSPGCTEWGFKWGTSPENYTESSWTSGSARSGQFPFDKTLTGLSSGTTYYFRAGAKDENGWGFTQELKFTTISVFPVLSCKNHNVWGWAWSSNIGWISFSCRNRSNVGEGNDYGVDIDETTGLFSGGAWSRGTNTDIGGVGWISFNRSETGAPPFDDVCPDDSCLAKLDFGTGKVSGWARAEIAGEKSIFWNKLYESYVIDYDAQWLWRDFLYGSRWQGQTFTVGATGPNETHEVKRISLFLYNASSSTETVVVSIRPSTSNNTDLCVGTKAIPPGSKGIYEWHDIFVEDGCILSPDTQYLIAARCPGCSSNNISWGSYVASSYLGGRDYKSDDGGVSWNISSSMPPDDFRFKIWGTSPGGILGLGGWDGWIKLGGTVQSDGSPYGVYLDSSGYQSLGYSEFRGWAWGGDDTVEEAVIGWVSFNCNNPETGNVCGVSDYKVMTSIKVNLPPSAALKEIPEYSYCFKNKPPIYLSWTFTDDDPGDFQSAYQIQIDNSGSGFPSPEIDEEISPSSSKQYTPILSFSTKYWWRVKVWDNQDAESDWSSVGSFRTDPPWPWPDFTWCPDEPFIDKPVQFCSVLEEGICEGAAEPSCNLASDLTRCEGAACVLWEWDFDIAVDADSDGTPDNDVESIDENPTYSYSVSGDHRARLTVTDANGKFCSKGKFVPTNIPFPIWREIPPF